MDTKERLSSQTFGEDAYRQLPKTIGYNRSYALTPDSKNALAVLAAAMSQIRIAQGRNKPDSVPSPWVEFHSIIRRLRDAGCNVVQARPGDALPLPTLWKNPITGEPLPAPTTPDEKAILAKLDPELLRWFESMGKAPYRTVAAYNEAEAQRESLSSIHYGEAEHKLNPWLGDNLTAQGDFEKRDPDLAKFYREEAKPVEIAIFGKNRDQTVIGQLAKNPSMAALVQLAARIHEQWLAEDRLSAEAARKAAEATLKRLERQAA
jgi:hypothetical protein